MAGISAVGTMVVVGHSFGAKKSANMVLAACSTSYILFVHSLNMVSVGSVHKEITPFVVCNCQLI